MTPTSPVLDRQALDDAAAHHTVGLVVDLADVRARAAERRRRSLWHDPRTLVPFVAACLAAAAVLVLLVLPTVQTARPAPATPPTGPATVPATLGEAPSWTPSITARPIGRALYLVSAAQLGTGIPDRPWLVGADGGEFRTLPTEGEVRATALSADGRRVAWADGPSTAQASRVRVLELGTAQAFDVPLPNADGRGVRVDSLAFSPDGTRLVMTGYASSGALGAVQRAVLLAQVGAPGAPGASGAPGTPGAADSSADSPAQRLCVCEEGAAWDVADGRLFLDAVPAQVEPLLGGAVRVASLARYDTVQSGSLGGEAPSGLFAQPLVRSGVRYGLLSWEGPVTAAHWSAGGVQYGAPIPASNAVGLAVTARGLLVSSHWLGRGNNPLTGRAAVSVTATGEPAGSGSVLTALEGERARVIAVAADLVDQGRRAGTTVRAPWPVADADWWPWAARTVLTGIVGLPWPWWFLLAVGGYAVVHRRRPELRVRAGRAALAVLAVLAVGSLAVVLGPTRAGVVTADPAAASGVPVLPRTIADQALVPPRAFDRLGVPRTSAVTVIYSGPLAGRQGVYGLDAATGTWVSLDDVGGLGDGGLGGGSGQVAVSPNGRWLTDGTMLVDLRTASTLGLPGDVAPNRMQRHASAVLDDGRVVVADRTLWTWAPPTATPLTPGVLAGPTPVGTTSDSVAVEAQGDGRVVVRRTGPGTLVDVVDPAGGAQAEPVPVPGVDQFEPVATAGSAVWRLSRVLTEVDSPSGRGVLAVPGAVDAIASVRSGPDQKGWTAVTLGSADPTRLAIATGTVVEGVPAGRAPAAVTKAVVRLGEGGGLPWTAGQNLDVAAALVAAATPIDAPGPAWWQPFVAPQGVRDAAPGVLLVSGLGLIGAAFRRFVSGRTLTP